VDDYARAARLLTLETPPQHRVFRRWYVETIVAQLRAATDGPPAVPQSFEQRLLAELDAVTAAQRMTDRGARLQAVTSALANATTAEEVAAVVVSEGVAALGASGGGLILAGADRLTVPAAVGYGGTLLEKLRAERPDAELPAAHALRSGEPVWLESRQSRDERFPDLGEMEAETVSLCAVPLRGADRILGALRFSFTSQRLFGDDERRFVYALAGQTAQALERSSLYEAERAARSAAESLAARLARLQQVMTGLAAVTELGEVIEVIITQAADAVGAVVASLCLVEGDTVRVAGIRGERMGTRERWGSFPLAADLPASEAIRTGELVVVPDRAELDRRYPDLVGYVHGERALVCLPMHVGGRAIGALTLSFGLERNIVDSGELAFLASLAEACGQAVGRVKALEAARLATDKLAFLAQASAELASSLDDRVTLASVANLVVPRLADWCTVHVLRDGQLEPVAVAHVDPDKVAFARRLQRRYPIDPDAPRGVPEVVRSGRAELVAEITPAMVDAADAPPELLDAVRELGLRSVLTVPLTGPAGTIGAIQLVSAESGRLYGQDDLALAEELGRRAALAVQNAWEYRQQTSRLATITRVAEAAQRAILAPVPPRVGPLALAAAYVSAAEEALVGGDFYETVVREGAVRLLIGDVRGKGLDAVRLATVVLGQFRAAGVECDGLGAVAAQMDQRLAPYLDDEDFVTALLVEVAPDGSCQLVSCGHPPALHVRAGTVSEVACSPSVPLGLGALPPPATIQLERGDRLLLYTDGLIEARDQAGHFAELDSLVAPLATEPLASALDHVLERLSAVAGGALADDLAMLVAEYRPR
jgi:GAF domain-containing protein